MNDLRRACLSLLRGHPVSLAGARAAGRSQVLLQVAAYDALVADEMADFEAFAATIRVQTEDGTLVPFNEWRDANRTP